MLRSTPLGRGGAYLLLGVVAVFVLLPIWGLFNVALDGSLKGAPVELRFVPKEPSLEAFRSVWNEPAQSLNFLGLLRNSLVVSGGAALVSVGFGLSAAYAFARFRFPGRGPGLFLLLLGTLLPPVALMTPLWLLLSMLGLRTSLLGLMLVYTAFAMPFCIWTMRAAFQAIPLELEEAALLDGASTLVTFVRVSLPLALPPIAVAALIAFVLGYSEFAIGWLFVESAQNVTLAMGISGLMDLGRPWSATAALALLMSLPVVILFLLLRRWLLTGLSLGTIQEEE
ncbi:MAG: carbohydrate ABC transporter permease [Anaerolineae bacterium]|nr:MAG: carbohydrate ABC transporter permease [Anaerolineae bacterium]